MRNVTIVLLLLFLSTSCFAQKFKTFVHPTDGYEIGIPKKWNIQHYDKISLVVFGPKYNKHYIKDGAITINIQPVKSEPFSDIYSRYIKQLKFNQGIEELGDQEINGRIYKVYIRSFRSGTKGKALEYFTIKDNQMLVASFISMEENFNTLAPFFRQIASTIKY